MKKLLYTLIATCLFIGFAEAQFNYQSVLRNNANEPMVNQSVGVQLTIMRDGSPVYRETHSTTSTAVGIINLQVCNGTTVSGDCATINFGDGSNYGLSVAVDETGGTSYTNYGMSPILAVPMASYANVAGTALTDNVDDADADPINEIQKLEWDPTRRALSITGSTGSISIPSTGGDGDPWPENEIQQLTRSGNNIVLSHNGGLVVDGQVEDMVDDADNDASNELQSLDLSGTILSISDGNAVNLDGLGGGGSSIWTKNGTEISYRAKVNGTDNIIYDEAKFHVNMGGTQNRHLDGRSTRFTDEMVFTTPNSGKQHGIGNYMEDFPTERSKMYMRLDGDTLFDVTTRNFIDQNNTTLTVSGVTGTTRIPGIQLRALGPIGQIQQFIGGAQGWTVGWNGQHTIAGIADPGNPTMLTAGVTYQNGQGIVFGNVKQFVMDHPEDPTKHIRYACIEGPEAAAYERGVITLVNGEAFIPFSDHFKHVINPETMTVNLTPNSAESMGLAVISKTHEGIRIKELAKGTGNYKVDWEAKAVRKGYEDYKVITDKEELRIQTSELD